MIVCHQASGPLLLCGCSCFMHVIWGIFCSTQKVQYICPELNRMKVYVYVLPDCSRTVERGRFGLGFTEWVNFWEETWREDLCLLLKSPLHIPQLVYQYFHTASITASSTFYLHSSSTCL